MTGEKNDVRNFRLPVNAGTNTDGFAEDVPLQETNNFVMLPDGSGLKPREGFEVRRNDGIGYDNARKRIYFISNPPDIDYGDMIILNNTRNNRQFIEQTEVVRTTNTKSLENPMSMPELPPYVEPLATVVPISGTIGSLITEGDFSFYDGSVLMYDTESKKALGVARVSAWPDDWTQFFRTENYLVYVSTSFTMTPTTYTTAWSLSDLATNYGDRKNASFFQTVCNAPDASSSYPIVFPYRGDIVYVLEDVGEGASSNEGPHSWRLYKVDLSLDAAESVTDQNLTGVPYEESSFVYELTNDAHTVDSEGYLWAWMTANTDDVPLNGNELVLVKIDPANAAVVAYKVFDSSIGFTIGMSALPDGEMLLCTRDGSNNLIASVMSADLQTVTPTALVDNSATGEVFNAPMRAGAIGSTILAQSNSAEDYAMLFDVKANAVVGTPFEWGSYYPGSVYNNSTLAVLKTERYYVSEADTWAPGEATYNSDGTGIYVTKLFVVYVDATAGVEVDRSWCAVIVSEPSEWPATIEDGVLVVEDEGQPLNDAFGYCVQNIQGDRL